MTTVRHVEDSRFMDSLSEILAGLGAGFVYRVGDGQRAFILGPVNLCGRLLGLVDQEYGWPVDVPLASIRSVEDLRPGPRRHPVLRDGTQALAIGIEVSEWELICASNSN